MSDTAVIDRTTTDDDFSLTDEHDMDFASLEDADLETPTGDDATAGDFSPTADPEVPGDNVGEEIDAAQSGDADG